ncbi:MAG: glycosidase [candidate division WOR-3 bacterium]
MKLKRYQHNPIIKPIKKHPWESKVTFNAAAISVGNKVHILYRARDKKMISRIGYAASDDGFHINERLPKPILEPELDIEAYGCEDPRITQIGDKIYLSYNAYGKNPKQGKHKNLYYSHTGVQVVLTSISVKDFLNKKWNWSKRCYLLPGVDDKGAVIFPEKFNGKYLMYHRIPPHIWYAYSDDLIHWYDHNILMMPQRNDWEFFKIGTGATPIKTEKGWLIIYHAASRQLVYRLGFAFADLEDPTKIIYRSPTPILEPEKEFETQGNVANVVFSCGAVLLGDEVFVYYGGADTVICVATAKLKDFYRAARLL